MLPFLWATYSVWAERWIHLSVRHRGPAWKYHHPSHVWLSDLSIACENTEKQLPENWEESNHESTTHSGEGANEMGDFQNTPAHTRARVTMRAPGAPSVTGQHWCLLLCWTQLYLQPKERHTAEVSKNQNLMWVTLQAPLSPGVLSNIRLMSLKFWDQPFYPLNWKATEKGQVSKCIKAHTDFASTHVPGLPREHPLQRCHSCWKGTAKGQSQTFWWQPCSTATGTAPC